MLNIYFSASIRGGREDADDYAKLCEELQKYGTVLTLVVAKKEIISELTEEVDAKAIYEQDINWFKDTDVMVAEVTQPSLGVGYELGWAAAHKIKTLCLFRRSCGRKLSAMIRGSHNGESVRVVDYDEIGEVNEILKDFMDSVKPKIKEKQSP